MKNPEPAGEIDGRPITAWTCDGCLNVVGTLDATRPPTGWLEEAGDLHYCGACKGERGR